MIRQTLLLGCALVGSAGAQELVAHRVGFEAFDWEGVASFDPADVHSALLQCAGSADVMHASRPLARYLDWLDEEITAGYQHAGFGDVEVDVSVTGDARRIRVRVEEGPRTLAGEVTVASESPELRAAILEALRDPEGTAFWREGDPARLSPRSLELMRWRVELFSRRQGRLATRADVSVTPDPDSGRASLRISTDDVKRSRIGPVRLEGCSEALADEVLAWLDHDPETLATPGALQRLHGALYESGRFARVEMPQPTLDGAAFAEQLDPIVIHVAPSNLETAPTDSERAEVDLLRATARSLIARLGSGERLEVSIAFDDPLRGESIRFEPGRLRVWFDSSGLLLETPPAVVGPLDVGALRFECSESCAFGLESEQLGTLLRIAPGTLAPLFTEVSFALQPLAPSEAAASQTSSTVRWGFRVRKNPPEPLGAPGLPERIEIRPRLNLLLWLSTPTAVHALRRFGGSSDDSKSLLLELPFEDLTVAIDRQRLDAELRSPTDSIQVRLVPGEERPWPAAAEPLEVLPGLADLLLGGTGVEASDLDALIQGLVAECRDLRFGDSPEADHTFVIPPADLTPDALARDFTENLARRFASRYPSRSWPHVLLSESAGLFARRNVRGPGFSAELRRLQNSSECGPLGWLCLAAVCKAFASEEMVAACAAESRKRLRFDSFWKDLEVLTHGSDLLDRVGARWRARLAQGTTRFAVEIEAALDDREAAKMGMNALWRAFLGKALLRSLDTIEGR